MSGDAYKSAKWLDEGFACYAAGRFCGGGDPALPETLLTLDAITTEAAWSSLEGAERWAAYRQAWFLVSMIVNRWGEDRVLDLVRALADSASLDGALEAHLGLDADGLEDMLRAAHENIRRRRLQTTDDMEGME